MQPGTDCSPGSDVVNVRRTDLEPCCSIKVVNVTFTAVLKTTVMSYFTD